MFLSFITKQQKACAFLKAKGTLQKKALLLFTGFFFFFSFFPPLFLLALGTA